MDTFEGGPEKRRWCAPSGLLTTAKRFLDSLPSIPFRIQGSMFKEHDQLVLTQSVPTEGLEPGDVGTVVHVYSDGLAYEIEFFTLDGQTAAVATVEAAHVRAVGKNEIIHARQLTLISRNP